jgi:hypothetical protein
MKETKKKKRVKWKKNAKHKENEKKWTTYANGSREKKNEMPFSR